MLMLKEEENHMKITLILHEYIMLNYQAWRLQTSKIWQISKNIAEPH